MRETKLHTVVLRDKKTVLGTWKLLAKSGAEAVRVIDNSPNHYPRYLRGRGRLVVVKSEDYPKPTKPGERLTVGFTGRPLFKDVPPEVSEAYTDDGKVWRWVSSDNCVPEDCAMEYGIPIDRAAQAVAHNADLTTFAASYREAMANRPPAEVEAERREARAAHGPGVELVNIITGTRFIT